MRSHIPMSIERSALPLEDDRARLRSDGELLTLSLAKRYFDFGRIWIRKAMAPGGVTGVIMAFIFVDATCAFLLVMRYIQELPPVSLTFLIPIVVAAIRWGTLSAVITAVGGAVSLTYFFYSPFYANTSG